MKCIDNTEEMEMKYTDNYVTGYSYRQLNSLLRCGKSLQYPICCPDTVPGVYTYTVLKFCFLCPLICGYNSQYS